MKSVNPAILTSCLTIFATACFSPWSEERRQAFERECHQTDTIQHLALEFRGFEPNELDSIWVKEYKETSLLDSFRLFVMPPQNPDDTVRKQRSAIIRRPMNIHHHYHFIVPGQNPYELANMKMIMWAQYTMFSEGWGCVMAEYTIDGERFERHTRPTFIKREGRQSRRF